MSNQPQPQGDGDSRPFSLHSQHGPVLVHLEKSGPAWNPTGFDKATLVTEDGGTVITGLVTPEFRDQLVQSLQAQAWSAAGQCFNAIDRKVLLDLMPAWSRLLKLAGQEPSTRTRTCLRRDWFWQEAQSGLVTALCYCETESASTKWIVADMVIRGEARVYAEHAERSLAEYAASLETHENAERLRRHIAAYTEFAEGRQ